MADPGLEDEILAVLARATKEGRRDVVEHLLRALEALCSDPSPGSPLAEAYLVLFSDRGPKPPH